MIKTLKAIAFAALALLTYVAGFSQQVGRSIPNSTSPDGIIGFLEFRPPDYGTQKHPLIIFLHGAGEVGNGSSQLPVVAYNALPNTLAQGGATMKFSVNGVASSFVVISPQLNPSYGFWPSFYVSEMIRYAKANLSIDPNRIYVTGLSLGGGGVWRLISDANTLDPSFDMNLAAAAPICATGEESDANFCRTVGANHLPVWAFHSMDDTRVSVSVTQHVEQVSRNCGVTPASKYTYYAYGDHSGAWISAYDFGHITKQLADGSYYTFNQNLYEWFLSNSRSNTTPPPPANTPPSVFIGPAQIINLPATTAILTGSGAGTNGASISAYNWAQTSGPSQAAILAAGSTSTQVTGLVQGTYTFSFTVRDNNGLTATASVTVTVTAVAANTPPLTTVAIPLQTVTLPTNSVTISGTGTGTNGATVSTYTWAQTNGPNLATFTAPGSTTTVVTGLIQGTYVFTLTVKDNHGLSSSATATVFVNAATSSTPTISAGTAQTITLPVNSLSLSGTATGSNGSSITNYSWVQTSGPNTAGISAPTSTTTTISGLVQGNYVFTFTARDSNGLFASATVTVTVRPASTGATKPVSDAGPAQTVTGTTATLNGSASYDPDGFIVEYYWSQVGGPAATIANHFGVSVIASNLVNGVYTFLLQVKDNSGLLTYSVTTVTVNTTATPPAANQAPISRPGAPQTVTGSTAVLNGLASTDPDGTISQYYWSQINGPSQVAISDNFSGTPTISGLVRGVYLMQLQVKDNTGTPSWATTTVTVTAAGARIADAGTAVTGSVDESLKVMSETALIPGKSIRMYPNPAISSTTIVLNSENADVRKIAVYNASGILVAGYRWPTIKGTNTYLLRNIAGFAKGLYFIQVTDSKGKITGVLKFVKS